MQPPRQPDISGKDGGRGKVSPGSPSSRNALVIAAGTLISRLLGFVRDAGIAWLLGSSGPADALTAALRIPYMARRLFGEGTLSLSLTASCAREHLRGGSGCGLALAVFRRLALWGTLPALACLVFAGAAMQLTAPGLPGRPDVFDEAVWLFRLCTPYLWSILLAAACMAALHSRRHFFLPTLAPSLFNVCVIGATLLAAFSPADLQPTLVASGVLAGGLLQWMMQLPFIIRLRREEPAAPPAPAAVFAALRRLPAGIAGAAMPQLAFIGASALASLLPEGQMASLFYAERLLEFPLGVLGAAVGMAAAPRLAELALAEGLIRKKTRDPSPDSPFSSEIRHACLLSLGLNLPAAAGLAAVSQPLVSTLLGHGAFDETAVSATALALCAYAPGLPAYALSRPLLAGSHALDDGFPLKAGSIALGAALVSGCILMRLFGTWGPPLGVSIGLWCNAALLWLRLGRRVRLRLPRKALCAQLAGTALTFLSAGGMLSFCGNVSAPVQLVLAIPAGVLAYGLTLLALDRGFFGLLRKRHG